MKEIRAKNLILENTNFSDRDEGEMKQIEMCKSCRPCKTKAFENV